jgi:hypothetical protein
LVIFRRWVQHRHVEPDGGFHGGLLQGLGHVFNHLSGIFVEQRIALHDALKVSGSIKTAGGVRFP